MKLKKMLPNKSPEPTSMTLSVPHSRLTDLAARLSFCRWHHLRFMKYHASLVFGALLISLFASCSKRPAHSAWTSSDSFIIEPRVSVGPVHSGMTMQQVVAALGEPDKNTFGNLEYLKLGISVVVPGNGNGGIVSSVMCGASGDSGMLKPFTGHTKDGIGIGASRAAIVSSYGNPTTTKQPIPGDELNTEFLDYDSLGIHFGLNDDKIVLIIVSFKP
jgi:hypothetical protein